MPRGLPTLARCRTCRTFPEAPEAQPLHSFLFLGRHSRPDRYFKNHEENILDARIAPWRAGHPHFPRLASSCLEGRGANGFSLATLPMGPAMS